jgi:ketosteroid isomerase-like protein
MGDECKGNENVELVKLLYRLFRERKGEETFEFLAEDIEWDATQVPMLGMDGIYRGHDEVRKFWRQWLDAWQEIEWQEVEPQELGDGRIRVHVVQRNRGRDSGIWVDQPLYDQLFTIEDGKVKRMEYRLLD